MVENPMVAAEPYVPYAVCDCGHEVNKGDTVLQWGGETFCDMDCLVDHIKLNVEEVEVR